MIKDKERICPIKKDCSRDTGRCYSPPHTRCGFYRAYETECFLKLRNPLRDSDDNRC